MDYIDAHLATASQNSLHSPAIRAALVLGKAHLNKYYDMTDHSEVYRIAMSECSFLVNLFKCQFCLTVLHLQHKLKYFRDANWDDAWVTAATAIVCDEFVRAYANLPTDDIVVISAKGVCITPIFLSPSKLTNIFSLLGPPSGIS